MSTEHIWYETSYIPPTPEELDRYAQQIVRYLIQDGPERANRRLLWTVINIRPASTPELFKRLQPYFDAGLLTKPGLGDEVHS